MVNTKGYKAFDAWLRARHKKGFDDKEKYKLMGRPEKEETRVLWARSSLKVLEDKKEASRSLSVTHSSRGRWLTFLKISEELGGDLEGAANYCKACVKEGPSEYYMQDG